jgi:ADP-ribose pyrophosphatase
MRVDFRFTFSLQRNTLWFMQSMPREKTNGTIHHPDRTGYPRNPVVAVGAVVFHREKVLLVRRGQDPGEGLWAIPGGGVELGETLQQAAEREIWEETGIRIKAREPVLTFDVIEKGERNRIRYHYVIVDLAADYIDGELRAGDDAAEARWVSRNEARRLPLNETSRRLLQTAFDFL